MQTVEFSKMNLDDDDVVLDLGCGEGRHAIGLSALNARLRCVALDKNIVDVKTAQQRWREFAPSADHCPLFMQADGEQLPFAENSFSKVICSEVLEHIANYEFFLAEIQRVLKPGGLLAISVPRAWPERICWWLSREYHEVDGGHLRIFRERELQGKVRELGFDLLSRHWAHALHVPYWWLRCMWWREGKQHWLVRTYHRFLLWDLFSKPTLTRILERVLNPLMGKSVVMYFRKRP